MSKIINAKTYANIWGRQADTLLSNPVEPQRADMFYVDLSLAVSALNAASGQTLVPVPPQFVRSVSLPEIRMKAEPYRRDSRVYNMPSWDDPVDSVKIVFFVDTWNATNRSDVAALLDTWIALVRAGRGGRSGGFTAGAGYLLDDHYSANCFFDIHVQLVRGGTLDDMAASFVASKTQNLKNASGYKAAQLNAFMSAGAQPQPPAHIYPELKTPDLVVHTTWVIRQAWCGGYRLSDLNYGDLQLHTLEANFFPESVERATLPIFAGSPVAYNDTARLKL